MFSFSNLIIGLIGLAGGIAMVYYAFILNHRVYFLDFVERRFGGGTGTTAYRIIGLFFCIFSVFVMLGRINLSGDVGTNPGTSKRSTPNKTNIVPTPANSGGSLIGQ
ncbi:MAG: hypothetical protein H7196_04770 [candidate division SR1 bacterium]|nr:hypothetical protein [candidate division SR1 bacterium]